MRNLFLATVAVFGFAATAYAGEGNGEPFPGPSADVTTTVTSPVYAHSSQDPFQYRIVGGATSVSSFKAVATKDQDPYQYRVAGQVIQMGAPVNGPQTGTAVASTTRGLTAPSVAGRGTHG